MKVANFIMLLGVLLLSSCSDRNSMADSPSPMSSRSSEGGIREFGTLHNLGLDCVRDFLVVHPECTIEEEYENNELLHELHGRLTSVMEDNYPAILPCSQGMIREVMNQKVSIYSQKDFMPITLPTKGEVDPFSDQFFSYLHTEFGFSDEEISFLKRIAFISKDDEGNYVSNEILESRLEQLRRDWELYYGDDAVNKPTNDNICSGIAMSIALSSFEWWKRWSELPENNMQKIAPFVAYMLAKDARGAIIGAIVSLTMTSDVTEVALHAVVEGILHSSVLLF